VAQATNAPVWCPELEKPVLANIMDFVPWPGFGPFESYEADHTVSGGETLTLAGLTIDVISTPGHSPGHVTYAVRDEPDDASAVRESEAGSRADRELAALFSGDVLFMGSVGRVDLPGGDWPTLLRSIETLVDAYPEETTIYPGHGPVTTLGRERATNPFLRELAQHQ
jgi:glyoxylase-like metal-dependent hydrolase (beta-lactamase superfamily II)